MTDSDPLAELDALFGFREMPVGIGPGTMTLKVRVMLPRKQVRVSSQLYERMIEVHQRLTELIDSAEKAETKDAMADLATEGEKAEDQLAAICIQGLGILCIDPPVAVLEQMQIADLAGLFARANKEQGEAAAQAITGQTGHPTPASSGS